MLNDTQLILDALKEPFPAEKIHWRVGPTYEGRCQPLAYIDARDVMDRLDDVVGGHRWESYFSETQTGRIICKLSLQIDDEGGWVVKSDGAGSTGQEGEKGAISDALKRAAVNFGIGRYLYGIKAPWVEMDGKKLPKNFNGAEYLKGSLPQRHIQHMNSAKENWSSIVAIKEFLAQDNLSAAWEAWSELREDHQIALRMAPTKGGIWTIEENKQLKQASDEDFDPDTGVYRSAAK